MTRDNDNYYPFYGWLLMAGVILFSSFLLWEFGLIGQLVEKDITYLSSVILFLFFIFTLYLGFASWQLSHQLTLAQNYQNEQSPPSSWAAEHITLLNWQRQQSNNESEPLLARLIEKIHRGHVNGWFFSDVLMRLGLIGTVIGFVLMLSTVFQLKDNDIQALQQLLGTMGSGMQVALYTTLSGLGCGLLISFQCQWLDRCADSLVSKIIELGIQEPKK